MFDIGFWELITIAIVAIIIVRPEQFPKFTKDAGKFLNNLRSYIQGAKKEIEKELSVKEVNELQNSINQVEKLMEQAPDKDVSKKSS